MNVNRRQILTGIIAVFCLLAIVYLVGKFTDKPVQVDGGYRLMMGTFNRIVAVAENNRLARVCIDAGFDEIRRVEDVMSYHNPDSELSRINREAFDNPVKVSQELFELLQKSVKFSRLSGGAFDITVGPLVDLWRKAGEINSMPDAAAVTDAKSRVGYEKLILDANAMTVKFAVAGMRLDLGGIAKGYAVDKAVEVMRQKGAIAGMVDVGGNIFCFGKPLDKDAWLVGVQDPELESTEPLMILKLGDCAVATSGDYRRFVTVAGKKVSHIIDAKTAGGANKLAGDTIIAKTALEADALSTAVNVLGVDEGLALIESLPDTECILIALPDYRVIKSSGAMNYIKPDSPDM